MGTSTKLRRTNSRRRVDFTNLLARLHIDSGALTPIEKLLAQYPSLKVFSYTSKYKNLQVENGLACEWFKKAEYKLSPESAPVRWQANGLLVLKRQSDGSWKGEMIVVK